MRKYQKAASLLSNRLPAGVTIEAIFELLLDEYLDRSDPARREERRLARKARLRGGNGTSVGGASDGSDTSAEDVDAGQRRGAMEKGTSAAGRGAKEKVDSSERRIPAEVRDRVHVRDGGRCAFTSPDGQRCAETLRLQVDHIVPWSLGGTHDPDNLRLLCAAHNQLQANRQFGAKHMARFRREE